MASKEGTAAQAFGPILAAVATMQGNVSRSEKTNAHEFLEKFQKSVSEPAPPPGIYRRACLFESDSFFFFFCFYC